MNRKIFVYLILLIGSFALTGRSVQAQLDPPGKPKFKVGDHVEFDSIQASDPSRARWVKATVVRLEVVKLGGGSLVQTSYVIRTETGYETSVTRHHAEEGGGGRGTGFLRALANDDTPPQDENPPNRETPQKKPPAPNNRAAGGNYNVGDCVDFDILQTGDATRAKWKKATITDIQIVKLGGGLTQLNYVVQLDQPGPRGLPERITVPQRLAEQGMSYAGEASRKTGFLRPRGCDGAPPKFEKAKLHLDANGNVAADRPLLDCDNLRRGPARNGQRPNLELMKQIIRCLWETPGTPNLHAPRKIDITEFVPGGTRRWDVENDAGEGGAINTIVYKFRVKYDSTIFNRDKNELELGHDGLFKCWVAIDKWQCGEDDILKWGQMKNVEVVK